MTFAAWGGRRRAQGSKCAPPSCEQLPQLSSLLQESHLFGAAQSFRGHFSVAHLGMTLQKQGTLETMQAEFGRSQTCVADGNYGRQEAWLCATSLATLGSEKMLRHHRNSLPLSRPPLSCWTVKYTEGFSLNSFNSHLPCLSLTPIGLAMCFILLHLDACLCLALRCLPQCSIRQ